MLAIIIVSWNVRTLIDRCIATAQASLADSGIDYRIMVVDNASTDGTTVLLRTRYPGVEVIEAGRNLGFAGGNNLALRRLFARNDWNARYVLLLNPDTEVIGDALPQMVRYLETHPEVVGSDRDCGTRTERCSRADDVTRPPESSSGRARLSSGAGATIHGYGITVALICRTTGNRRSIGWWERR